MEPLGGFNQAKCWRQQTVMCDGSILSCCPRNPHGYERVLKEEDIKRLAGYAQIKSCFIGKVNSFFD